MRDLASLCAEVPDNSEMVLMIIEAHASCGRLLRTHWNQQLKFQFLLDLTCRHHLPGSSKEGIARRRNPVRNPESICKFIGTREPSRSKFNYFLRRANTDIFSHTE